MATSTVDPAGRNARIRRSALLLGAVAAFFYVGCLLILVWRAGR